MMDLYGEYFCGNRISDYGLQNRRLDYGTLAKAINMVMANDLIRQTDGKVGFWEFVSGDPESEVFQWFIVDDGDAETLQEIGEIVLWNEELDLHLWGVTHWGTAWDYVLTDVPCCTGQV